MINYQDFTKVDIRMGRIIEVGDFLEAKKPAYKLKIDFGKEIGIKNSSAQLTANYSRDDLLGKIVVGVVNLEPRQIGSFCSEVLILGVPDDNGECVLLAVDEEVTLGEKIY